LTPAWMMWVAARIPTWPAVIVLGTLYIVGSGIGAIASDLYWLLRWHIEHRGKYGRAKWREEVCQMAERM
jgi:hypothetical protein